MDTRSISRPIPSKVRNRPDLEDDDLNRLDRARVDIQLQALDFRRYHAGDGNNGQELIDTSAIKSNQRCIRSSSRSRVTSIEIWGQWFASKTNWIPEGDGIWRDLYEAEKANLQTLRKRPHWHIVLLMWHFFRKENEGGLILSPLAECNLYEFLSQPPTLGRKALLRKCFGCLTAALETIHSLKMKHKDIKTPNILIHGDNIIIADVDISHTFEEDSESLGTSPGSAAYMPPEVGRGEPRGRNQDIWSLLCCFVEMAAYLTGKTIDEFRSRCARRDEPEEPFKFTRSYEIIHEYLAELKNKSTLLEERALLDVISSSFQRDQAKRPDAMTLLRKIRSIGHNTYIGECCVADVPAILPNATFSQTSLVGDPRDLEFDSLAHFVVSASGRITATLSSSAAKASFDELFHRINSGKIRSVRSAERSFLFYIAPDRCGSAEEYLALCRVFIGELADFVENRDAQACVLRQVVVNDRRASPDPLAFNPYHDPPLYDTELGEEEQEYSNAYFAILIDVVLNRCRTRLWRNNG